MTEVSGFCYITLVSIYLTDKLFRLFESASNERVVDNKKEIQQAMHRFKNKNKKFCTIFSTVRTMYWLVVKNK